MDTAKMFAKFADDCMGMAKFSHTPESRTEWARMAERWLRYAEMYDRRTLDAHRNRSKKRNRAPGHGWSH
jgi:hypothetical protein